MVTLEADGRGALPMESELGSFPGCPMETRLDLTVPQSLPAPLLVTSRFIASSSLHCMDIRVLRPKL